MNIFFLDKNPVKAAHQMCDVHCNKMFLENLQILATLFPLDRLAQDDVPRTKKGTPWKHGHYNHPCTKWARTKKGFEWLLEHTKELEKERLFRNFNPHFSSAFFAWVCDHTNEMVFDDVVLPYPVAIAQDMLCRKDPNFSDNSCITDKYKLYYIHDKPFAKWTRKPERMPQWFKNKSIL